MSKAMASSDESEARFTIPGALSPADAQKICDELKQHLDAAREAATKPSVDIDGDATPCALQMLIAVTRSATARDLGLSLSDNARNALAGIALEDARI